MNSDQRYYVSGHYVQVIGTQPVGKRKTYNVNVRPKHSESMRLGMSKPTLAEAMNDILERLLDSDDDACLAAADLAGYWVDRGYF